MRPPRDSSLDALPVHERIRKRREQLGWTASEMARRAGISASYVSLIESGAKVPHARVALKLAEVLGDDPDLYLAWTHASRHDDLTIFDRMRPWLRASTDDPGFARRVASGKQLYRRAEPALADRDSTVVSEAPFASGPTDRELEMGIVSERGDDEPSRITLVEIPVLVEGADPGDDPRRCGAVLETLKMDRRALPPGPIERPFAYRPGPEGVRRVRKLIHPGDLVVLTSATGRLSPDRVHALRHKGRVVLTRVLFKKRALLMLPPDGADEFEVVQVGSRGDLDRLIAGTVILTTRFWRAAEPSQRVKLASVAARAGRLLGSKLGLVESPERERLLVRDCHWKEKYGWRPIQRREDLETLEANPGMRIRFRLIRKDRVQYHLEMNADQWRDALGPYGDTPGWRRNGYITPVTKMRDGEYTLDFKDRWAPYVREA